MVEKAPIVAGAYLSRVVWTFDLEMYIFLALNIVDNYVIYNLWCMCNTHEHYYINIYFLLLLMY